MAFRDSMLALDVRAAALEGELGRETRRADEAEAEVARLRRELDDIRRGASREQDLRDDVHFNIAQVLLPAASIIGLVWALVLRLVIFGSTFGGLYPSAIGLRVFARQLAQAEGLLALGLVIVAIIVAILPLIAAFGLARRRRWGWIMAVVSYLPFLAAFPPLGLYALVALCRTSTTAAFFGPRRVDEDLDVGA
jgi:hypothetical protein